VAPGGVGLLGSAPGVLGVVGPPVAGRRGATWKGARTGLVRGCWGAPGAAAVVGVVGPVGWFGWFG